MFPNVLYKGRQLEVTSGLSESLTTGQLWCHACPYLMMLQYCVLFETMIYNHCHLSPNSSSAVLPCLTAIVNAARQVEDIIISRPCKMCGKIFQM